MDLTTIEMARDEARDRYHEYRDYGTTDEDDAIARGYRALARGDSVIHLADSICAGGLDGDGRPRLAVMRADLTECYLRHDRDGELWFQLEPWPRGNQRQGIYHFDVGTLPTGTATAGWRSLRAMVPIVPPSLRPRHHLRNYEILWEVERWEQAPRPPRDPALLKHLAGDLYSVLATWDLTDLERAVLSDGRLV